MPSATLHCMYPEPIHVTVAGSPDDPRLPRSFPAGVIVHHVPELHPDDVCTVRGLPVTSPSRTIIDCAEDMSEPELDAMFRRAIARGLIDRRSMEASLSRVEWRPSLALVRTLVERHFR